MNIHRLATANASNAGILSCSIEHDGTSCHTPSLQPIKADELFMSTAQVPGTNAVQDTWVHVSAQQHVCCMSGTHSICLAPCTITSMGYGFRVEPKP